MRPRCYRCGHESLQMGRLRGFDDIGFRPDHPDLASREIAEVAVLATMCRQCGAIELSGDVEMLRRLAPEE